MINKIETRKDMRNKKVIFRVDNMNMYTNKYNHNAITAENDRFVDMFDKLNDDVIGMIYDKLPVETTVWLTKENYCKNHKIVRKMIEPEFYESYILDIVKQDYAFVFSEIIKERFDNFHKWKGYYFNETRHHSFLTFLRHFATTNNSPKCVEVIDIRAIEKGFSPNWYKYRGIILRSR